jgi:aspartate aminotransferase-like enzyme
MNDLKKKVKKLNESKILFTPGPSSLSYENISQLKPCFGRGDDEYIKLESKVLNKIKKISGHNKISRLQGSASLAIEIMIYNFIYGKVLIVATGVYSERLKDMALFAKSKFKYIKKVEYVNYNNLNNLKKSFDWIIACPVETSTGFKIPIEDLYKLKKKFKSKLALDATASIGLEKDHHLSEVTAFSSCKGLFGLTGAAFLTYDELPQNEINSFYLNLQNHVNKKMTGPYHIMYSLSHILDNYQDYFYSVKINKRRFLKSMKDYISYPLINQPMLCTYVTKEIKKKNDKVVLYQSRAKIKGSVVCHLGEVHLKRKAKGNIQKLIY